MSERVPAAEIEKIVGVTRHPIQHWGRMVRGRMFILHSTACKGEFDDLRDCPFSLALDGGIHLADFYGHLEGHPVMLGIDPSGWLVPAELADTRARVAATHENEGTEP